jgi:hypothetical protein
MSADAVSVKAPSANFHNTLGGPPTGVADLMGLRLSGAPVCTVQPAIQRRHNKTTKITPSNPQACSNWSPLFEAGQLLQRIQRMPSIRFGHLTTPFVPVPAGLPSSGVTTASVIEKIVENMTKEDSVVNILGFIPADSVTFGTWCASWLVQPPKPAHSSTSSTEIPSLLLAMLLTTMRDDSIVAVCDCGGSAAILAPLHNDCGRRWGCILCSNCILLMLFGLCAAVWMCWCSMALEVPKVRCSHCYDPWS